MTDRLIAQLKKDPAVVELLSGLKEGRGPAAVFSLPDAARAPVFAALSEERTTLVVLDTEAAAIDLYSEIKAYRPDALPFLPRELPLVHVQAAAPERRSQRLGVLSRLVLGVPTLIISCAAALMERLAPPEAFVSQVKVVKPARWPCGATFWTCSRPRGRTPAGSSFSTTRWTSSAGST